MEKTDYPMELNNSEKNVLNYYGISCEHNNAHMHNLPEIEDEISHLSSKLGNCKNPEEFVSTLCLLVQTVKNTPVKNKYTEEILLEEQMRRRDLLNLLILCKTTRDGDNIIIKNRSRSFKLNNGSNWIVKAVDDILARELGNVKIEDAVLELNKTATGHRGRRAKDPQMLNIIWGTYLFVSDMYNLSSPMPNALCHFIIKLLQLMDILPDNTEIDAYWVRAQLRYLSSRRQREESVK